MSSILILKPIIDVLYDDVKEYKNKMEKRVKELEEEIASLKAQRKRQVVASNVVVLDESDDEAFAEAALAGLAHEPVVKQVEIKNEVEDTTSTVQEDTKTVKMIGGKDAKEYMKEYQRNYRKKQKENMINKT
jgi:hypothetical protein